MEEKHWWQGYPWRMLQTNLREIDMADIDADAYAEQLKEYGATVVTLNAAGIIASYQTQLDCQTQSPYLTGSSLHEIIDACHKRGIRVIARTDFSKLREGVFARHPDWAYRDKNGEVVNYNGNIQTCPNGAYQKEKSLEILREVLTTHPFDGVFCNMSGFLVVDYSGVYHGPCHCENCKRLFKEQYGLDIPDRDDPRSPDYRKYAAFKSACTKAQRERLVQTVRSISPELAINNVDYIRTESATEIGVPQWQYSASCNARRTAGPLRLRPADNASVDFMGFRYRDSSVSAGQLALRPVAEPCQCRQREPVYYGAFGQPQGSNSTERIQGRLCLPQGTRGALPRSAKCCQGAAGDKTHHGAQRPRSVRLGACPDREPHSL